MYICTVVATYVHLQSSNMYYLIVNVLRRRDSCYAGDTNDMFPFKYLEEFPFRFFFYLSCQIIILNAIKDCAA